MKIAADIESLARERRRMLLAGLTTMALGLGCMILRQTGWFHDEVLRLLSLAAVLFMVLWMLTYLWMRRWASRVRANPEAMRALDDEVTVHNRGRAQRASFWTVLVCLGIGVAVTSFQDVSGRLTMEAVIWLMAVSQVGFYLWYDRD